MREWWWDQLRLICSRHRKMKGSECDDCERKKLICLSSSICISVNEYAIRYYTDSSLSRLNTCTCIITRTHTCTHMLHNTQIHTHKRTHSSRHTYHTHAHTHKKTHANTHAKYTHTYITHKCTLTCTSMRNVFYMTISTHPLTLYRTPTSRLSLSHTLSFTHTHTHIYTHLKRGRAEQSPPAAISVVSVIKKPSDFFLPFSSMMFFFIHDVRSF